VRDAPFAVFAWAPSNLIAALTIGGLFYYGFLRLGYASFYREFGLRPEDVGLGYAALLSRGASNVVLLVLSGALAAGFVVAGVVVAAGVAWLVARQLGRPLSFPSLGRTLVSVLAYGTIAAIVVFAVTAPAQTREAADGIKRGDRGPRRLLSAGLGAERARISWIAEAPTAQLRAAERHPLVYLGGSSESLAFYDLVERRTLRIPAASVVVTVNPSE
jgi:hypothetical protein